MFFILAAMWLMSADIAQSCPAFLTAEKLPAWVSNSSPKELRLFTLNPKLNWEQQPLQIDPITSEGLFDQSRHKTDTQPTIQPKDRFVFYTEKFGQQVSSKTTLPCQTSNLVEVTAPGPTFGYIARCQSSDSNSITVNPTLPVTIESKDRKITSSQFEYIYNPRNELLYESLSAVTPDGRLLRSAYDANIGLRIDVKKFFTLHFDDGDIESYVNASKTGELGVVESVAFYLRLFALKFDLKINTIASFFKSGANIPMIVDVPVDAAGRLNPASGSIYTLKLDKAEFEMDHPLSSMPNFDGKLVSAGSEDIKKAGLRRCKGNRCEYKMMGRLENNSFALAMSVPREAVEMGFFPMFVYDVKEFKNDLGWKGADKSTPNERAIFFQTHNLTKGKYKVDSWIILGADSQKATSCPAEADISRNLDASWLGPQIGH